MPVAVIIAQAPSGQLIFSNDKVPTILRHPLKPITKIADYEQYGCLQADGKPRAAEDYSIVKALSKGEIITGEETNYMNSAAQKLTGCKTSEALGQNATEIIQIIDERTNQPIAHPIEQVLQQGKVIYLNEYAALGTSKLKNSPHSPNYLRLARYFGSINFLEVP